MTPDAAPLLRFLDQQFPRLRQINTYESIGELSQRFVALAGPEWAPIGKTQGESQWHPPNFIGYNLTLNDPQGTPRMVGITGWSHDAVWHLPSHTQVKLISNSAANSDPDPAIHGIGNIACYLIDPVNYRWYNPPIPLERQPSLPTPNPALPGDHPGTGQPGGQGILAMGLAFEFLKQLNAFYASPDGLQRPGGMVLDDGTVDMEAVARWFYAGVVEGRPFTWVVEQIKLSDEYRRKHHLI